MCDKEQYPTREIAREAAKGVSRAGKDSMGYYWCDQCEAWHLETRGKRPRWRSRNNNKYPFRYHPKKKK